MWTFIDRFWTRHARLPYNTAHLNFFSCTFHTTRIFHGSKSVKCLLQIFTSSSNTKLPSRQTKVWKFAIIKNKIKAVVRLYRQSATRSRNEITTENYCSDKHRSSYTHTLYKVHTLRQHFKLFRVERATLMYL